MHTPKQFEKTKKQLEFENNSQSTEKADAKKELDRRENLEKGKK